MKSKMLLLTVLSGTFIGLGVVINQKASAITPLMSASAAIAPATCTPTGFMRDNINMTAAKINPSSVTGVVNATGCNIGVYYDAGHNGTIKNAEILGANYFGVVANDSDVRSVLISELKKDFTVDTGDSFQIVLDTFHDERNAYHFIINPAGAKWGLSLQAAVIVKYRDAKTDARVQLEDLLR